MKNIIILAVLLIAIVSLTSCMKAETEQPFPEAPQQPPVAEQPPGPPGLDDCICTMEYAPVCGVDGKTYSNRCFAGCAKVEILRDGEC